MGAIKRYQWAALTGVLLLAAGFAGCKQAEGTGSNASRERTRPVVTDLSGTVECNGQPVPFGYVVFFDLPQPGESSGPAKTLAWSQISETGSYFAKNAPVGDQIRVLVITDPTECDKTVRRFSDMIALDGRSLRGEPPAPSTLHSSRHGPERQGGPKHSQSYLGSQPMPPPQSDPNDDPENIKPPSRSPSQAGTRGPRQGKLPDMERGKLVGQGSGLPETIARDRITFEGLPEATRDLLAKIGKKYGENLGAISQSIAKGQKEFDIKLTVD